jgi:hypothetical protein
VQPRAKRPQGTDNIIITTYTTYTSVIITDTTTCTSIIITAYTTHTSIIMYITHLYIYLYILYYILSDLPPSGRGSGKYVQRPPRGIRHHGGTVDANARRNARNRRPGNIVYNTVLLIHN